MMPALLHAAGARAHGAHLHGGSCSVTSLWLRVLGAAVLAATLLLHAWPAQAQPEDPPALLQFSDPVRQERFKHLLHELRCLVCQNQSLADSDASLAHDLRREVYTMINDGSSDQEIIQFLVARYGDFVLYRPPVTTTTYLLWFGPFLLLVLGLFTLFYFVRRRKQTTEPALSEAERARIQQLLGRTTGKEEGA
jgi:cytochrome c-type biogenesis protein CcmH